MVAEFARPHGRGGCSLPNRIDRHSAIATTELPVGFATLACAWRLADAWTYRSPGQHPPALAFDERGLRPRRLHDPESRATLPPRILVR